MKRKTVIKIYQELNALCFNNVLTMPAIHASRSDDMHAAYQPFVGRPVIWYNPRMSFLLAWTVIFHEMVHQFVEEILQITEDNHHGPIFWRTYKRFAPVFGPRAFLWI